MESEGSLAKTEPKAYLRWGPDDVWPSEDWGRRWNLGNDDSMAEGAGRRKKLGLRISFGREVVKTEQRGPYG